MNEYFHLLNHRVRSQELMKQAANIRLRNEANPSSRLRFPNLVGMVGVLIAAVVHLIRRS
jgi:hypothetical protein